jgi:hypothetical protein
MIKMNVPIWERFAVNLKLKSEVKQSKMAIPIMCTQCIRKEEKIIQIKELSKLEEQ